MSSTDEVDPGVSASSPELVESLDALLAFGAAMFRAGNTAFRTHQWMDLVARGLGLERLSVQLTLGNLCVCARRSGELATLMREVGSGSVNAQRIGELEELARSAEPGISPAALIDRLSVLEATPPRYKAWQTSLAVGMACGAFTFLNGGNGLEMTAAAFAGGSAQRLRSALIARQFNQYGITGICALSATLAYCLFAAVWPRIDLGVAGRTAGFISSSLFLVPGFPVVAALVDLLQQQTSAALTRMAHALTLLLAAALGVCAAAALVGLEVEPAIPRTFENPLLFGLRALASFAGACGFAILFNSPPRNVLMVGLLAVVGNLVRLELRDAGVNLPPAAFLGALAVGMSASAARGWINEPRIALTVPGVVMMVPGVSAFHMVAELNQGGMLEALREGSLVAFAVGAMAMGLAVARFLDERSYGAVAKE